MGFAKASILPAQEPGATARNPREPGNASSEAFARTDDSPRKTGPAKQAVSLVAAVARYLANGLETVAKQEYDERLQICQPCQYLTGKRCRLCRCFIAQKAWLPLEECPAGKWPKHYR